MNVPAAHDIGRPAEKLAQARSHNIDIPQHIDVYEISYSVIYDNQKPMIVGKLAEAREIWGLQKWIRRALAEECGDWRYF